jgi:lipoprotein NlpD
MVEMDEPVNRDVLRTGLSILLSAAIVLFCLQACSGNPPAPVEERRIGDRLQNRVLPAPAAYIVKSGDTLYAIAFRFGLDHGDIAEWNGLQSTNLIRPGQRLVLRPPPVTAGKAPGKSPPAGNRAASRPYEPPPPAVRKAPSSGSTATAKPAASAASPKEKISWQWPAQGKIIRTFKADDPGRLGLDIGGSAGQPIKAAASGTVVYSGNGLIGYGELIIIKHNDRLLSAYAYNRKRLVSENEQVRAGQKIAEMGRNGSNRVMLHFEVRENGSPVDPMRHLPRH